MKRMKASACYTAMAALCLATVANADDADVVDYRKHIMSALNAEAAIMGQMASGAIPNDDVLQHLDAIASIASTALKSFEAKVPGGGAKSTVWSNWADFSKRMTEFQENTAKAAKLGHTAGKDTGLTEMLTALDCKGCHDTYRQEKK
jgi:cytochrome c556